MKIGFLIINYNDFDTTIKLIKQIKDYSCIDKILIVDNCSTNDSFEKISMFENNKLILIKNRANLGYSSAINLGCKYLEKELNKCKIIVSNPDIEVCSDYEMKKLVESMPKDSGIIAPVIKEHKGLNRGWKIPTPLVDVILNILYINRFLRPKLTFYNEEYYCGKLTQVQAVSGCFFIIDSSILREVNYFDEEIFLYYEENIIGKKLEKFKKDIYINNEVSVFHNHSVSIDKSLNKLSKYKQLKKSQYYFQKEYNDPNLLMLILLKITEKFSFGILYIFYYLKKLF